MTGTNGSFIALLINPTTSHREELERWIRERLRRGERTLLPDMCVAPGFFPSTVAVLPNSGCMDRYASQVETGNLTAVLFSAIYRESGSKLLVVAGDDPYLLQAEERLPEGTQICWFEETR